MNAVSSSVVEWVINIDWQYYCLYFLKWLIKLQYPLEERMLSFRSISSLLWNWWLFFSLSPISKTNFVYFLFDINFIEYRVQTNILSDYGGIVNSPHYSISTMRAFECHAHSRARIGLVQFTEPFWPNSIYTA